MLSHQDRDRSKPGEQISPDWSRLGVPSTTAAIATALESG